MTPSILKPVLEPSDFSQGLYVAYMEVGLVRRIVQSSILSFWHDIPKITTVIHSHPSSYQYPTTVYPNTPYVAKRRVCISKTSKSDDKKMTPPHLWICHLRPSEFQAFDFVWPWQPTLMIPWPKLFIHLPVSFQGATAPAGQWMLCSWCQCLVPRAHHPTHSLNPLDLSTWRKPHWLKHVVLAAHPAWKHRTVTFISVAVPPPKWCCHQKIPTSHKPGGRANPQELGHHVLRTVGLVHEKSRETHQMFTICTLKKIAESTSNLKALSIKCDTQWHRDDVAGAAGYPQNTARLPKQDRQNTHHDAQTQWHILNTKNKYGYCSFLYYCNSKTSFGTQHSNEVLLVLQCMMLSNHQQDSLASVNSGLDSNPRTLFLRACQNVG